MSIYTRNWQHIVLSMIRTIHRPIPLWHVVPLWSQLYCKCYPKEDTELANFDDYIGQFSGLRCCWQIIDLPGPRLNDLPRKHIIKTTFVALLHWKMALVTLSNAELWWIQKLKSGELFDRDLWDFYCDLAGLPDSMWFLGYTSYVCSMAGPDGRSLTALWKYGCMSHSIEPFVMSYKI